MAVENLFSARLEQARRLLRFGHLFLRRGCIDNPAMTDTPLIPRRILFDNPNRAGVQISPDGAWLSWLAPVNGVMNIHLAPSGDIEQSMAITNDTDQGIYNFSWGRMSDVILYQQDENGTEEWHVYAVDVETKETIDLTPMEGVHAMITGLSWEHPHHIVVGINDRDPAWHDLHLVDIRSGDRELIYSNTEGFSSFTLDRELELKVATQTQPTGGSKLFRFEAGNPVEFMSITHEDDLTTGPVGFVRDGSQFYMFSSVGRDTGALLTMDWQSGESTVVATNNEADISRVMFDPESFEVQAVLSNYTRAEWTALDPDVGADLDWLDAQLDGEVMVTSQTRDNGTWIVAEQSADKPVHYYVFARDGRQLDALFSARDELENVDLAPMETPVIAARDGLKLVSFLTRAKGVEGKAPLVLVVHGGPWARDSYGYNPTHQWLADRGYHALSVNFRGSHGFGKRFLNAGDLEWGAKMHDDLLDAVAWAVSEGLCARDQVAIYGGSYGGYATLAGLTFTPETFACGVDIVGPSNLETLLETIPPYWTAFYENLARRVGDPRTEDGLALLKERSPLNHAEKISKPLLIAQGANDPRVKQAESDQIVEVMIENGLPVIYVLYPEEGHGFRRPENRMSFTAITEVFLAQHLGGRFEPIGNDFEGAKLEFVAGRGEFQRLATTDQAACG